MENINWPETLLANESKLREAIDAKCVEDGDCLRWAGPVDTNGSPVLRLKGHRKLLSAKRVLAFLDGQKIEGKVVVSMCECENCMLHIQPVTRKVLAHLNVKNTQYHKSPVRNHKIAQSARTRLSGLDMERVLEMRSSGLSSRAAAKEYGVCQSAASDILSGRSWKDYSNPWAGL